MNILKSTLIYLIATIVEKGMAFLLIPLYTHYLTPKDYGILTISQALITLFVIIFSLSLNGASSRYHFEGKSLYRRYHYGNIFLTVTIITAFILLVLTTFKDKLFNFLGLPLYPYFYIIVSISYLNIIFLIYQTKLQMEDRAYLYSILSILKFLLNTLFAVIFVVLFDKKAIGVLESSLIALSIIDIFILFKLLKEDRIRLNLNRKLLKRNLAYSIYLVPHNLSSILNQLLDRFFISKLINLSQVGIYSLGGQIALSLTLIANIFNRALVSKTIRAFKDKNYSYIIEVGEITVFILLYFAAILSLFSKDIVELVAPKEYKDAYRVVVILSFYAVYQMYYFRVNGPLFYMEGGTKFVALSTFLSLIINFGLNYTLISKFGIEGASFATLLSIMIVTFIVIHISNRFIKLEFNHKKLNIIIVTLFLIVNFANNYGLTISKRVLLTILITLAFIYILSRYSLIESIVKSALKRR